MSLLQGRKISPGFWFLFPMLFTHIPIDSCMEKKLSPSLEYGTRASTHQRQWKWVFFSLLYVYLGTVSFKSPWGQNSAPLLANNVIIKLLLRGHNISFSPVFRKNSAQTKSIMYGLDKPKSPNQFQTSKV